MRKKVWRIPTILGLFIIFTTFGLATALYLYNDQIEKKLKAQYTPIDNQIQVVNLTDSSATIAWQTSRPAVGRLIFAPSPILSLTKGDDRDSTAETKPRFTHIVTLHNLSPKQQYFFQIKNDSYQFPNQTISFTLPQPLSRTENILVKNKPIAGKVLNRALEGIEDVLVFLQIPGAQQLVTTTNPAGNFIFTLTNLRNNKLDQFFEIQPGTTAKILITQGKITSTVQFTLTAQEQLLPAIILGLNYDLDQQSTKPPPGIFDINSDGQVDNIDLNLVESRLGEKGFSSADLNFDGIVDEKDVQLMKKALQ